LVELTGAFDIELKEAEIDLALKNEELNALTKKINDAEAIHVKMVSGDSRYVRLGE